MNEEGWGLKDVLIFLAIVALCLLVSMVIYKKTFTQLFYGTSGGITDIDRETYQSVETDLEKTAHTYTDNYYYKILEDGDSGYVTIRNMQDKKLLKVVKDIEDDNVICSGYVYFNKIGVVTNYDAYLKCGDNYQTEGYEASHDEKVNQ